MNGIDNKPAGNNFYSNIELMRPLCVNNPKRILMIDMKSHSPTVKRNDFRVKQL